MQHKCIYKYLYTVQRTMKFISICFIILISNKVDAQTPETNPDKLRTTNWYFGTNAALKFKNDSITQLSNGKTNHWEGTAVATGQDGELHFYTDGIRIWNNSGVVVNSANPLLGRQSATQAVSLIPSRSSDSIYHIFTNTDAGAAESKTYYYKVKFNSNFGATEISKTLVQSLGTEKGNTLNHHNARDQWYVSHMYSGNQFYSFLLKDTSKICCPVLARGVTNYDVSVKASSQGQLKFSNNGTLMVDAICNPFENRADLYVFSQEEGTVKFDTSLNIFRPYGASFNNGGTSLFLSNTQGKLYKYHTTEKTLIEISSYLKKDITGLQLTFNDNIIVSEPVGNTLSIIDSEGSFTKDSIILTTGESHYSLPNFNASYFYTPSIDFAYTEDCWGHSYNFEGRDTLQATSWKWIFEKGSVSDSLFTKHCKYPFSDTGKWEVSHIASTATRSDTVTKTLTIRPKWKNDVLGKDTFYCTGDSINLTLQAPIDMHCIHWNDEEPNLDESLGPIVDYDHFHTDTLLVDTAGTYIVKLTNKTFCQMWDTIAIREEARPSKSVISRSGQELESSIVAAEYRWYFNGSLKNTTTDSKLTPDSNGYWQVQLISEYGCESELSDSFNVGFAGIDKRYETLDLRFEIYPNPSDGNITIAVPKGGDYQVKLSTIGGQLVSRGGPNFQSELYRSVNKKIELDIKLPAANYILTLTNAEGDMGSRQITIY